LAEPETIEETGHSSE